MNIIEAIKKIYPNIQGGFGYAETDNGVAWQNPIEGLRWESQEYPKPTWEQIQEVLPLVELEQAKTQKHHQIEGDYLKANLEDKIHEGLILQGKGVGTIRKFKFKQKYNNSIPALDSDRFLLICINANKPLPYETEAKEGDKIVVQIKPEKAREILDHMIYRYQVNYAIFSVLKNKINFCKNLDEVNKIVWDPSVITQDQLTQVNKLLNS